MVTLFLLFTFIRLQLILIVNGHFFLIRKAAKLNNGSISLVLIWIGYDTFRHGLNKKEIRMVAMTISKAG